MAPLDRPALAARYSAVKASIPGNVTLVAVSKTRTVEEIRALYDLGHRAFGENYPQELREKVPQLPQDIEWHFIGHLQRSNVKHVIPFAHMIHGLDSERLLDEVAKRANDLGRSVDVLLQVLIAQEETKHGFSMDEAKATMLAPWKWPGLRLRGLMGMATNTDDRTLVKREFEDLAGLFHSFEEAMRPTFDTLSMGMSGDASIAIEAGSTMVRIGTAIFGERC
ncbi:MAG: YggS family pyridoxal phosphate-dependent enzyme [Flavobacteriales bacterium]|nr:YggS family pyridoxal phosphate-dependent enzyme [Flavobacteriales bacterium]